MSEAWFLELREHIYNTECIMMFIRCTSGSGNRCADKEPGTQWAATLQCTGACKEAGLPEGAC
jgi:hypothetical protein